jgi:hypothetical protein
MRVSARQGAACALVAVAVLAGAFALGTATAPDATPAGAPTVDGPNGIEVPALGKVAALPELSEEAPAPVVEVESESEEAGSAVSEAPFTETPAPAEEASASPEPEAAPAPSGSSEEVVPEGL